MEILLNKRKYILSNLYKSPNPTNGSTQNHNDLFISYLDTHLHNLSLCNNNVFVFTDSNINLLNLNHNNTTALYLETLYSNGFSQKVGKATRIQNKSFSLIDHIICKSLSQDITTGTIITDFSDHFTNFVSIPSTKQSHVQQFRYARDFSKQKINEFKNTLSTLRWNSVLTLDDTNAAFDEFWSIFYTLFELYFPLQKNRTKQKHSQIK